MKEIVSFSELDTYRQCPLKHQLAYHQRWTKPPMPGRPLARGSLWHKVMEAHYRGIQLAQETTPTGHIPAELEASILETIYNVSVVPLLVNSDGIQTPDQRLIEWMYRGYVQQWGADRDWKILEIEASRIVPLPALNGGTSNKYFLKLRTDLLVRDRLGRTWLVDHKSCSNLPTQQELDIDDQFGLYTAAHRQLGVPVFGAIHSASRTQQLKGDQDGDKPTPLDKRFARAFTYRSDVELDNLWHDAARTARASRRPEPPYSSPSSDRCKWRCDFLDAHLAMRKGIPPKTALTDGGFIQDFTRH